MTLGNKAPITALHCANWINGGDENTDLTPPGAGDSFEDAYHLGGNHYTEHTVIELEDLPGFAPPTRCIVSRLRVVIVPNNESICLFNLIDYYGRSTYEPDGWPAFRELHDIQVSTSGVALTVPKPEPPHNSNVFFGCASDICKFWGDADAILVIYSAIHGSSDPNNYEVGLFVLSGQAGYRSVRVEDFAVPRDKHRDSSFRPCVIAGRGARFKLGYNTIRQHRRSQFGIRLAPRRRQCSSFDCCQMEGCSIRV